MVAWIVAFVLLLSVWPMYQLRPDHNAVLAASEQSVRWRRVLAGKINGGLAVAGGSVYVESFDGRVTALNARTGRLEWSTVLPNVVMTTPIIADGLVIIGTGTSAVLTQTASRVIWGRAQGDAVVAIDMRNGRLRWQRQTVGEDMASPALVRVGSRDAIVFANGDDRVRALDVHTGNTLWETPVRGIDSMSSAAIHNGRVFVIVGGPANWNTPDRLLAIDAASGRIAWRAPFGNADCSPAVAGGRILIEGSASTSGRPADRNAFNDVIAVDEDTGSLLWRWYSGYGTFTAVASDEEAIAGLAADGAFYESIPTTKQFASFDGRTGHVRWIIRTRGAVKMSAVEKDGRLYFGDTAGIFYVLDARRGSTISEAPYPHSFSTSSPVIVGNTLYVANDDTVYAVPLPM